MDNRELLQHDGGVTATPAADPSTFLGLRWAIKSSFLAYVARTPDGKIYLGKGVTVTDSDEFQFGLDETPAPADDVADHVLSFSGDLGFVAHMGMLYVRITRPRVVLRGDSGELFVVSPESDDSGEIRLATFTADEPVVEEGRRRWETTDVRLTEAGVPLFGDVYQAGELFAPLTIIAPE